MANLELILKINEVNTWNLVYKTESTIGKSRSNSQTKLMHSMHNKNVIIEHIKDKISQIQGQIQAEKGHKLGIKT